jgi:hypothetical protein
MTIEQNYGTNPNAREGQDEAIAGNGKTWWDNDFRHDGEEVIIDSSDDAYLEYGDDTIW